MNRDVWKNLIALFYPNICLTCAKPLLSGEKFICIGCFMSICNHRCTISGEDDLLGKFAVFPEVISARSFMTFERTGPARKLVYAFKYKGQQTLAEFLGQLMARQSRQLYDTDVWDGLIPVPLHFSRLKERGYNQAEMLAKGFGNEIGLPVYDDLVSRIRKTDTQTRKNKLNRWKSTDDLYMLTGKDSVIGKNMLIIDDVVTTGATISGVVEVLRDAGVNQIGIVSLASE